MDRNIHYFVLLLLISVSCNVLLAQHKTIEHQKPFLLLKEDFGSHLIASLDTVFYDPEGKYQLRATSTSKLTAQVDSRKLFFHSVPDSNGDTFINVSAHLGSTIVDSLSIWVKIAPINDSPHPFVLLTPADEDSVTSTDVPLRFSWDEAKDVDQQELFYSLHIDNGKSLLTFEDIGRTWIELFPSEFASRPGRYLWYASVTDGEFQVQSSDTFSLSVLPNDASGNHVAQDGRSILGQNHPNPFNPHTSIPLKLASKSNVRLEIFNIVGKPVKTLVDKELEPGSYCFRWDGKNAIGVNLASGIYFYRLQTDKAQFNRKLILIR
ncbi:MAG: FlgD immunoglobulin-like domain containing protein [Calditrichia bacterium]